MRTQVQIPLSDSSHHDVLNFDKLLTTVKNNESLRISQVIVPPQPPQSNSDSEVFP